MPVGADADARAVLAEIQVGVLVAQHRPGGFGGMGGQWRNRTRPGELMGQGSQRKDLADHRGDLRAPDAGAADDDVSGDVTTVGPDTGDLVAGRQYIEDFVMLENGCAAGGRAIELRGHGTDGFGDTVIGNEQSSQDDARVEQIPGLRGLRRIQ
jgi:hypothetical protein